MILVQFIKYDFFREHVEIAEVEQDATNSLLTARECLISNHPDAAMLYCRKALECIVHHLYFLEKGEYPKENPDGSRPGFVSLLKTLNSSMGRQTKTVLFSINAQTRGSMHWDVESRGEVADNHHVDDVISQIRSVFLDLFTIELALDGMKIDDSTLENTVKKNMAIDLSNLTNEGQSEEDFSEEELEDIGAILDVAGFATEKDISFDPLERFELAKIAHLRGNLVEAEAHYSAALNDLSENEVAAIATALNGLADIALDNGKIGDARDYWVKLRQHAITHSDNHLESQAIGNLGLVDMREGKLESAKQLYIEGMKIQESLGERIDVAISLYNLANIAIHENDIGRAYTSSMEAYEIFTELDQEAYHIAKCADQMGSIVGLLGNQEMAMIFHQEARDIFLSFDEPDISSVILCIGNEASCLFRMGRLNESNNKFSDMLELSEKSSNAYGLASALIGLGGIEIELENYDSAEELFRRADSVSSESGDMQSRLSILHELSLIAGKKEDYDTAIDLVEEMLELCNKHGYHQKVELGRKNLEEFRSRRDSVTD
jgi:tetratricopeptide (TPR) repeat protein